MSAGEDYFGWLYHQNFAIWDPESDQSYIGVCRLLHSTIFNDSVPHDDNRAAEGMQLRDEYQSTMRSMDLREFAELRDLGGATILEVLVALSRRAVDFVEKASWEWFTIFLGNLDLLRYPDSRFGPRAQTAIQRRINVMNSRTYDYNGKGGLFPLKNPSTDQRKVELWYQLHAFMRDRRMY